MDAIQIVQEYLNKKKIIEELLLDYLENDDKENAIFDKLINYLYNHNIPTSKKDMKTFLRLISKIADHHYRNPAFFEKILNIIKIVQKEFKNLFTNVEIFNFFKKNKLLLLFLFETQIIFPEKSIFDIICTGKYKKRFYLEYFYPEFKSFLDDKIRQNIMSEYPEITSDTFYEKRKNGKNDNYICQLIQKDSIVEFVGHVNQADLELDEFNIKPSIYETNLALLRDKVKLIEYAAFYGSIKIFNYLKGYVLINYKSLMSYLIHSKSVKLFHIIEEDLSGKSNIIYYCYVYSIICHHNDITNYIKNNLEFDNLDEENFKHSFSRCIGNYNFIEYEEIINNELIDISIKYELENEMKDGIIFLSWVVFDDIDVVDLIIKKTNINLNSIIILK